MHPFLTNQLPNERFPFILMFFIPFPAHYKLLGPIKAALCESIHLKQHNKCLSRLTLNSPLPERTLLPSLLISSLLSASHCNKARRIRSVKCEKFTLFLPFPYMVKGYKSCRLTCFKLNGCMRTVCSSMGNGSSSKTFPDVKVQT